MRNSMHQSHWLTVFKTFADYRLVIRVVALSLTLVVLAADEHRSQPRSEHRDQASRKEPARGQRRVALPPAARSNAFTHAQRRDSVPVRVQATWWTASSR